MDYDDGWYLWRNGKTFHSFLANHIVSGLDGVAAHYGCRVTIITVPLSVLKGGDIAFAPDLPEALNNNIYTRGWSRGFSVFLEFDPGFVPYEWSCFPVDNYNHYDEDGLLLG